MVVAPVTECVPIMYLKYYKKGSRQMAKVLMKGNEALAESALRAGCRFFSGYPITPQTEILEYMS